MDELELYCRERVVRTAGRYLLERLIIVDQRNGHRVALKMSSPLSPEC